MYSGIVQCIGSVGEICELDNTASGGSGHSITFTNAATVLDNCAIGDSIAVNGCCLTVTEFTPDSFKANVSPETLRLTNLSTLSVGSPVNLEKSLGVNGTFGGSFVQVCLNNLIFIHTLC